MRGQLSHIIDVATELPNVRVQVMPFSYGAHSGMNGPFFVLQFPDRAVMRSLIYLENMADAWVSRREGDVERYKEAFTDLQALAPGPQESLSLIEEAVKEF